MQLLDRAHEFIEQPFPLWENNLTDLLVKKKWEELKRNGLTDTSQYTTARIYLNNFRISQDKKFPINTVNSEESILLEEPSYKHLNEFYDEHGLVLHSSIEEEITSVKLKINSALEVIRLIAPAYTCIRSLVRCIQILRQDDDEIDISYTHPQIPFSIFISVCNDESLISNLRVAESIIHESMHLKLTLIENNIPLIRPGTLETFFSPWRAENRPLQGVLHGLFVFKAVNEFYCNVKRYIDSSEAELYIDHRCEQIEREINQLNNFYKSSGFTEHGATLTKNLLPLS